MFSTKTIAFPTLLWFCITLCIIETEEKHRAMNLEYPRVFFFVFGTDLFGCIIDTLHVNIHL